MKRTKKSRPNSTANAALQWMAEKKRLRKEIKELKAERDQYKKSLMAFMWEDPPPINKQEMLALAGQRPTLEEVIGRLEAEGD
jgi:hypothetical protein